MPRRGELFWIYGVVRRRRHRRDESVRGAAAVLRVAVSAGIRRRRRRSYRSAELELKDIDEADAAAELVFATVGARPDLGDILRRANEELGADADVLIGGPQRLVDGLEDRLKGRVVERMTWAM